MPLTNAQYDRILRVYNERQLKSRHDLDRRREEVYAKLPRLAEIDGEVAGASVRKARYLLGDRSGSDIDIDKTLADLAEERRALLLAAGYPEDYLEPRYVCPICHDTGYVDGRKCSCFRQMEIRLLYSESNLPSAVREDTFEKFSLDYYDPDERARDGRTFREEAEQALADARAFTASFGSDLAGGTAGNLFLYGDVGVGKTFLSHCIANELIRQGHFVLCTTAYQLFDTLGKYRFSSDEQMKGAHDSVFSSDLLIIDDLGTELINNFVTSELFLIINERILRKKSTIISTNLSLAAFRDSFSERTFSRIMGSYQLLHLSGRDIRIQKKLSGGN